MHFATYVLVDHRNPELTSLELSRVDDSGKEVDGSVRMYELLRLNLSADLAVLSGSQTAIGKESSREGLTSLSTGFMYAGVPRVVASLWNIDDEATAELMRRFYQNLLKTNNTPAAALRAAQVEMLNHPRWQSPYYWAAFTLQGEWR